jgi:uncharacterized membrane protein required for colicin V production
MNWLDIVIIIIASIGGILGWRVGIIRVAFTVIGCVLGVVLAGQLGEPLGQTMEFIENQNAAKVAGFAAIFGMTFLGASITSSLLQKFLKIFLLGWVDKVSGSVLGAGVGTFAVTAIIIASASFPFSGMDEAIENSDFSPPLADNVPFILNLLPEKYRDILSYLPGETIIPTTTIQSIKLTEVTDDKISLQLGLDLTNQNPFGGYISDVTYQLIWNEGKKPIELGSGQISKEFRLPAKGSTTIELPIELTKEFVPEFDLLLQSITNGLQTTLGTNGQFTTSFRKEDIEVLFEGIINNFQAEH